MDVLPSLYEEFIDIENKSFYVKKISEKRYLSFAYDENVIIENIKNANLELSKVNKIYFAQIELTNKMKELNVSYLKIDDLSLSLVNDTLVKIPSNLKVNIEKKLDIQEVVLSKESISVSSSSKYLNNKTSTILSIFFFLLTCIFMVKTIVNYDVVKIYENKVENVKEKSNNSLSSIQIKSIVKKYDKEFSNQIKIRNLFEYVLGLKSKFQMKVLSFEFENKVLKLKIENKKSDRLLEKKIEKYMKKVYKKSTIKKRSAFFLLEVKL